MNTPPLDQVTQRWVIQLTIIGTIIVQLACLAILAAIALKYDSEVSNSITGAIEIFLTANTLAGAGVAIMHILRGQSATSLGGAPINTMIPAENNKVENNGHS